MNEKITNYPIIEALCEFQFIPSQPWDMTIPGIFYERVKGEFSIKKQQMGFGIGFRPKDKEIQQRVEMTQRIQFFRPDESALIQIGPNLLVINHLRPYPKWEIFKPLILKNLEIYKSIANPKGYKRILLRYINKFEFAVKSVDLKEFFNFYPFIPDKLPSFSHFNVQVEFGFREENDKLLMTLSSAIPDKPDVTWLIFDIHYFLQNPDNISLTQASDWIETAHDQINNVFNESITKKCKSTFSKEM